jgi:uncharacterized protein (UPF0147 family)
MTLQHAIDTLSYLVEEGEFSRRAQETAAKVIMILQSQQDMAVEKALFELETISSDMNSYHRTQVWEVISILESI